MSTAASVVDVAGQFLPAVDIALVIESATNPRKWFEGIDAMADSIRGKGVLQPLVARPHPERGPEEIYELVAGARRLRGARQAGVGTVPVIVRDLTDAQVIEIQVVENNQREDVHPLEEADGIAALVRMGQDAATVADKLGRPVAYVAKRLVLTSLTIGLRKLWLDDGLIGVGHAMLLARLSAGQQDAYAGRWAEWPGGIPTTVARLRSQIEHDVEHPLSGAPWKRDDATLLPAAGRTTAARSGRGTTEPCSTTSTPATTAAWTRFATRPRGRRTSRCRWRS